MTATVVLTPVREDNLKTQERIELKQLVGISWPDDWTTGLKIYNNVISDAMNGLQDCFVSVFVVCSSSSKRNAHLIGNIIKSINTQSNNVEYMFDEKKYDQPRTGIWMCSKPLENLHAPSGDPTHIILMDMKGTIDEYTSSTNVKDMMEFGLLLSSVFIFNFGENIEEEVFQKLSPLTEYAKQAIHFNDAKYYYDRVVSDQEDGFTPTKRKPFQNIVILEQKPNTQDPLLAICSTQILVEFSDNAYNLHGSLGFSPLQTRRAKTVRELVLSYSDNIYYSPNRDQTLMIPFGRIGEPKLLCGVPISQSFFCDFVELMAEICKGYVTTLKDSASFFEKKATMMVLCLDNFVAFITHIITTKYTQKMQSIEDGCYNISYNNIKCNIFECQNRFQMDLQAYAKSLVCRNDIQRPDPLLFAGLLKRLQIHAMECKTQVSKVVEIFEGKCRNKVAEEQTKMNTRATNFIHKAIDDCISTWDNTRYIHDMDFSLQLKAIHKSVAQQIKEAYTEANEEYVTDLLTKLMESESVEKLLHIKNKETYSIILDNARKALLTVLEKLAEKVIEEINCDRSKSPEGFDTFCRQQRYMHENYFLRNYRKNFCQHVFSMEWPNCQAILDQLLAILKNKYIDRMVAKVTVTQEEVLLELNMSPSVSHEHTTTVEVDFGNEDTKHVVFPKLQIHIVNILADRQTTTMAILQLCQLGIFDAIEMELPLHGTFQLERDRVLSLTRVIQNRNSDDVKRCLHRLCNLQGLGATSLKFREAFASVFPKCIKS